METAVRLAGYRRQRNGGRLTSKQVRRALKQIRRMVSGDGAR
jgi:hypothetical protein